MVAAQEVSTIGGRALAGPPLRSGLPARRNETILWRFWREAHRGGGRHMLLIDGL